MKSKDYQKLAEQYIAGVTCLNSKHPDMFAPGYIAPYYDHADGIIIEIDGKEYRDFSYNGIGTCLLGYNNITINRAVSEAVWRGNMSTFNYPLETIFAEKFCKWRGKDKIKYARTGGEAVAIAIRIARAFHDKKIGDNFHYKNILFSGYHGWHDWFVMGDCFTKEMLGVPKYSDDCNTTPIVFNDHNGLLDEIKHPDNLSCLIIEPVRNEDPTPEWIDAVNKAYDSGITVIIDYITAGFRFKEFGYKRHMEVWGKALSNGYPFACVVGDADRMDAVNDTFISSTYWTEGTGISAANATFEILRNKDITELYEKGYKVKDIWIGCASRHGIEVTTSGQDSMAILNFEYDNALTWKTVFTTLMFDRGFIASTAFYASYAHTESDINDYSQAVDEVFGIMSKAENIESLLKGDVCKGGVIKRII